jgi:hypothetical protein
MVAVPAETARTVTPSVVTVAMLVLRDVKVAALVTSYSAASESLALALARAWWYVLLVHSISPIRVTGTFAFDDGYPVKVTSSWDSSTIGIESGIEDRPNMLMVAVTVTVPQPVAVEGICNVVPLTVPHDGEDTPYTTRESVDISVWLPSS